MAIKTLPLAFIALLFLLIISINCDKSPSNCKLFNFGDSNTDTGFACNDPNDRTYYGPLCRPSDGRLYLDYLCDSLGMDLLVPYLNPKGLDFTSGVNIAVYGMTIIDDDAHQYPLSVQVDEFEHYTKLISKGKGLRIINDEVQNAIFTIDIGQNDCFFGIGNSSYQEILDTKIPSFVEGIENATKKLYQLGGRKFLIYNTGPLGYLPLVTKGRTDFYNNIASAFNKGLSSLCMKLRSNLKDAMILYMDMYSIKRDLIKNSSKYGFESASVPCGHDKTVCHSVFWDNAHYSDAANKIVASKIWTSDYSSPHMNIKDLCDMVIKKIRRFSWTHLL